MKKHPDWFKMYWEVEQVALKGAHAAVHGLYNYLRSLSPGYECEEVMTTKTVLKADLRLGNSTITKYLEELRKRRLIKYDMVARKEGITVEFIFNYKDSTIKKVQGQVIFLLPNREDKKIILPNREDSDPNQDDYLPNWEQLPYIDRELEHVHNALLKQVIKQLGDLNVYPRMYEPLIQTKLGARFVHEVLTCHPNESGPVIRKKIQDAKNLNEFKVIDMFYREASQMPNGTPLTHFKTGEQGEWEWNGRSGYVRLEGDNVYIDSLASFRGWQRA